jgi:hypothetical protein
MMQIYGHAVSEAIAALGPMTIFSREKLERLAERFDAEGRHRAAEWARSRAYFLSDDEEE